VYHARVGHGGKLYRESLKVKDLALAKRKLRDFKDRLERTDPRLGKIALIASLGKFMLRPSNELPSRRSHAERDSGLGDGSASWVHYLGPLILMNCLTCSNGKTYNLNTGVKFGLLRRLAGFHHFVSLHLVSYCYYFRE